MPALRKRGAVWHYSFTVEGRRFRSSSGTTDKRLAADIAIEAESRQRRAAVHGAEAVLTFDEAVALYIEDHDSRYVLPLLDHFKSTLVSRILAPMIREAAVKLYPNASAATRNRQAITPCQAIINHAASEGLCKKIAVDRFPVSKKRRPAGSKAWLAAFQAEARGMGLHDVAALARFLFETGARIGQGAMLTNNDLDLAGGFAVLRTRKTGPNGPEVAERTAWLTPTMVAELANLPKRPYQVFGYGCRDTAQKQWRRVLDAGNVPRLTSHEAGRHGFATEMIVRHGIDPVTAAERGGWNTPRLLMDTYAHADAERAVIDEVFGEPKSRSGARQRRKGG